MSEAQFEQEKIRTAQKEEKLIFDGVIFKVKVANLTFADGKKRQKELVDHLGAVICLPILPDGRLILIKQYRQAVDQILIELPAGKLEKGENPATCAIRELKEEIGYAPEKLISLGGFFTTPGFCNEYMHVFIAAELKEDRLPPDDGEGIDPFEATIEETLQLIKQEKIQDAKTIVAITRYLLWKNKSF